MPQPRGPKPLQMRPTANFSMANIAATSNTLVDLSWYPNSGASHHMTPNSTNLQDSSDYTGSYLVLVGNGSSLCIKHISNSIFQSSSNSQSFKLNKLLHVPQITKNLLNISQFASDNSAFFEFHPNCCFVKSQRSKETLLQGKIRNGLYTIDSFKPAPSVSSQFAFVNKNVDFQLWHSRLGHPTPNIVSSVLKSCNLSFPVTSSICSACCMGKAHQLPFSLSESIYTAPLQLVYSDV